MLIERERSTDRERFARGFTVFSSLNCCYVESEDSPEFLFFSGQRTVCYADNTRLNYCEFCARIALCHQLEGTNLRPRTLFGTVNRPFEFDGFPVGNRGSISGSGLG